MHQLITLTHPMKCAITGILIDKGEQAYYNYETKNCIHPLEYESNMSKAKIGDPINLCPECLEYCDWEDEEETNEETTTTPKNQ